VEKVARSANQFDPFVLYMDPEINSMAQSVVGKLYGLFHIRLTKTLHFKNEIDPINDFYRR